MSTTPAERRSALPPERRALLERRLDDGRDSGLDNVTGSAIPVLPPDAVRPLSFAQQGLWFLDQIDPGSARHNLPTAVRLAGALDVQALQDALTAIVTRHEILRTTIIVDDDGKARQIVLEPGPIALAITDLSALPAPERMIQAAELIDRDAARPYDLTTEPPFRATLIQLAPDDHILALTIHHVAFDQWSARVLRRELTTLYAARQLPPLPIQYADYAAWQRNSLQGERLAELLAFWRDQLAGLTVLRLQTDRPHPATRSYAGALHQFTIPKPTTERLRLLGRASGTTSYMVLLAGFQALLARYTRSEDVAVGTPVAGRSHPDTEPLIGLFVNTLVLRTDLSGDPTFTELLARVRKVALDAQAHDGLPFERLVDELGQRNGARHPLFGVMFSFQADGTAQDTAPLELTGEGLCDFPVTQTTTQFDLTLEVIEAGDNLYGAVEFSTELFDPATVERFAEHFTRLLSAVGADPDVRLADLDLRSAEECTSLQEWGAGPQTDVPNRLVHEIVAEVAHDLPDQLAAVGLTYRELDERANQLAHLLLAHGAGPERAVAVCLDSGPELFVAVLAVWKSGSIYVPISPDGPADRRAFQLRDSAAVAVIAADSVTVEMAATQPKTPPAVPLRPQNAAYLIYTSGSTGTPKAVVVQHDGLANLVAALQTRFGVTPDDRVLQFFSTAFDGSVWDFVLALTAGAMLVPAGDRRRDPTDLAAYVTAQAITLASLPPTLLATLTPADLPTLRTLVAAGEQLPAEIATRWQVPGLRLFNGYGPTESTVAATVAAPTAGAEMPPIGRPLANTTVAVLDGRLQPVPVGVPGELYIAGPQLARGYLGQPVQSAERFVAGPGGSRLYRTGDLARWRADGQLEYLGRADRQLKIRGYRIEPTEVADALAAHVDIRAAAVASAAGTLVGYVTVDRRTPTADELRRHLTTRLPEHMVPAAFVVLDEMPLTNGGKVNLRALPVPAADRIEPGTVYAPPTTAAEHTLTVIWSEVLGVERVGIHDNFFALGGDSILAIQVVTRARAQGLHVTPAQLFDSPQVAALAAAAGVATPVEVDQGPLSGPLGLFPIHHWWAGQQLLEPAHFNQTALLCTTGPVDAGLLEEALGALVTHHDALRLRASGYPSRLQLSVAADASISLRRHRTDDRTNDIAAIAAASQRGLDLVNGPILRADLIEQDGGTFLLLVAHHLAVDTVSWSILIDDLTRAYRRLERGRRPELGPKTDSIRRWAKHLAGLAGTVAELDYWADPARRSSIRLPVDHDTGSVTVGQAATHPFCLDPRLTARLLRAAPTTYRAQINDFLLAALAMAVRTWTGGDRVLVDLENHGRTHTGDLDLSRTVGWFTALAPIALDATDDPIQTLITIKEQARAFPRSGLGYGVLRYLGDPSTRRRLAEIPAAEIGFTYHGQFGAGVGGGDAEPLFTVASGPTGPDQDPGTPLPHLLDLSAAISAGQLDLTLTFPTTRYRRRTIENLADQFVGALRRLIEAGEHASAGDATPSDFPLADLTQQQVDQLTAIAAVTVEDAYPLSPMQHGMLFHTLLEPDSGMYVQQIIHQLEGPLDHELLRAAFQRLVDRHPVLRTAIRQPLQVVAARTDIQFTSHHWHDLPPEQWRERLAALLAADRTRGFDLSRPGLARVTVISRTPVDHTLLLSAHHLLLDGWSMELLTADLVDAYRGLALTPRRPYRDFIGWLHRQDDHLAFWRDQLDGFTDTTPLAIEPRQDTAGHDIHDWALPEGTSRTLARFARQHSLTVSTLMRGALALLLATYAGRDDVCFGATVAGRPAGLPGAEDMIGLFINTVPVRTRVPADLAVADFLQRLQRQQLDQQDHQHTGLADIQANRTLFDTILVVENYPTVSPSGPDAEPAGAPAESPDLRVCGSSVIEYGNYPITLAVGPGVPIHLALSYDKARFSGGAVHRIADQITTILTAVADNPDRRLGDIAVLSPAEQARMSEWSNGPTMPYDGALIHDMIGSRATACPAATAVVSGGRRLSYADLWDRASRLARRLVEFGGGPETVVAVCLEPGADLVVSQLAVWRAGAAYLPIDPGYPLERIAFCLADAGAGLIVTSADLLDLLPDQPVPLVLVDDRVDGDPLEAAAYDPATTAYLIYTSGSTGVPKAVATTHHGLAQLARAQQRHLGVSAVDRVLQFASASFDAAIWETAMALTAGATLVVADTEQRRDPRLLAQCVTSHEVSAATLPPAILAALDPGQLPTLRLVVSAGERLTGDLAARWNTSARRLVNAYGPTETTVCAAAGDVAAGERRPAIGRPLPGTNCYVLDRQLRQVPTGVTGELCVAGDSVTRGYHHRPPLTAACFVANPYKAGTRLYRTGDLARWSADGRLEYVGRADDQVKLHGHRVEPGEIEAALASHPRVDAAAVVARDRLVGYVVVAGDPLGPEELRGYLAARLPAQLVPAVYVHLDRLPLTPNGKVDRAALPDPSGRTTAATYEPPSTPTEHALADIWRAAIGVPRVGVQDNFFELGGHSLLAMSVVTRLHALLGVELPVAALFENPVLKRFAAVADGVVRTEPLPPIAPVDRTGPIPLSFAQQRLWFLSQLEPASAEYAIPVAISLSAGVDVAKLTGALEAIVGRHEILRTTITTSNGIPAQLIHPPGPIGLPIIDLSTLDPDQASSQAQAQLARETLRPFDLATEPGMRGLLLRMPGGEYVLGLTFHHSCFDQVSVGVFSRELGLFYGTEINGADPGLPPLPVQYADYAGWLAERSFDQHVDYWREQLTGLRPLELPTDRQRPVVPDPSGATLGFTIDAATTAKLRSLSHRADASMFMTLTAVFQLLLAIHSGSQDVAIGMPTANREHPDIADLIGFFVNTLVLRIDTGGDPTFLELLARARKVALDAYAHQSVPFEHLVQSLDPGRDRSRHPFFQVMLTFDAGSDRVGRTELAGVELCGFPLAPAVSQFDLTWNLAEEDGAIHGAVVYRTALFDDATIRRLVDQFAVLSEKIAESPGVRVSQLDPRTTAERQRMADWASGPAAPAPDRLVHELIAAQARATPDHPAVVAADGVLSYAALDRRANGLAWHLRQRGIGPESVVAVRLPRGLDLVIALLGIWQAGAAYLPVDPADPRLDEQLVDSGAALLLTELPDDTADAPDVPVHVQVHADNTAYLIYTSGSTGRPKAVAVPHGGLVNRLLWQVDAHEFTAGDRILHKSPVTFDVSLWELCCPLLAGGTLVVAAADEHRDPTAIAARITGTGVTVAHFVPSMLDPFLDSAMACPTLRLIVSSGEALPPELASRCADRFQIRNLYGPAEASIDVTAGHPPSIGTPVRNTTVAVLDRHLLDVPAGVRGELFLGGVQLARGYHRRPALTAERFVAAPGGARRYRTGDLARWRPDGQLDYLGRTDNQLKIRGHRVEPGEIEHVLRAHPRIRTAAVAAHDDQLVGYLVADGPPVPGSELRAYVAERLPATMIPATFRWLPQLPLTASGKLDRRALPSVRGDRRDLATAYRQPVTPTEHAMAEIWREVLGVDRIGRDDNFFDLGGHSLLATRITARLRALLAVPVPVAAIFDNPTLAGLAKHVDGAVRTEPLPSIAPLGEAAPMPLSFAQQRLWFLHELEPDSTEYHLPAAVPITGELDIDALRRAVTEIVSRHAVLRTTIGTDPDGTPRQVVRAPALVEFTDSNTPFDLANEIPIRARIVRLADGANVLALTLHHIAADEWSLDILAHELSTVYGAFAAGEPSPLEPLPIQYADYAAWQRGWLTGDLEARHLAYWRGQLADLPTLLLPTDRPRTPARDPAGAVQFFSVGNDITGKLRELGRRGGATMFMTLLAAFQAFLSRCAGTDDIPVGTPVAGRTHPETERLVGFFVNTLVLRTDTSGDPTFAELLRRVRGTALAAYEHQDLPFEHLVEALNPDRDRSRHPLFQVMFSYGTATGEPDTCGLPVPYTATPFDLTLSLTEAGDGLSGSFEYSTALFDATTVDRLVEDFTRWLGWLGELPDRHLSELPPLVDPGIGYGPRIEPYAQVAVHEIIAAHRSNKIAVSSATEQLSYAELDALATDIAARLRGVRPEAVVAVLLQRTARVVAAMLGILKAGAVYLPIDPDTPADRLAYLLSDSDAAVVVTTADLMDRIPAGAPVVRLDEPQNGAVADMRVHPDSGAYLIYTSGSTGRPKGALGTHRNLVQLHRAWTHLHDLSPDDVWLTTANVAFDVFTGDWVRALLSGATLHIGPDRARLDPGRLADLLVQHRITAFETTPQQLAGLRERLTPETAPALRLMVVAADLWPVGDYRATRTLFPGTRLFTAYGLTETSVDSTGHQVTGAENRPMQPIGGPLPYAAVHVLDPRTLRPAPTGEIHIAGPGVTRGYPRRPALTAARFVADPLAGDGSRMYRTGDLARRLPDGELRLLGRTDQQINLAGRRIEPGEIEHALVGHPCVREAVVTADAGRLLAYVTTDGQPTDLRAFLKLSLPSYLVPAVVVRCETLPRTSTGKVDRNALTAPAGAGDAAGYEPPRTPTEQALAGIWRELLDRDRVGARDDFFDLGGHSLLATRVVGRARQALAVDLPVAAVFDAPTLAGLAEVVDTLVWVQHGSPLGESSDEYEDWEL